MTIICIGNTEAAWTILRIDGEDSIKKHFYFYKPFKSGRDALCGLSGTCSLTKANAEKCRECQAKLEVNAVGYYELLDTMKQIAGVRDTAIREATARMADTHLSEMFHYLVVCQDCGKKGELFSQYDKESGDSLVAKRCQCQCRIWMITGRVSDD